MASCAVRRRCPALGTLPAQGFALISPQCQGPPGCSQLCWFIVHLARCPPESLKYVKSVKTTNKLTFITLISDWFLLSVYPSGLKKETSMDARALLADTEGKCYSPAPGLRDASGHVSAGVACQISYPAMALTQFQV